MITCARLGCEETFIPVTHNQKYHNAECCRIETNAKIMRKYYAKRAQRLGIPRHCSSCNSKLSRYNDNEICNSCASKGRVIVNNEITNMLMGVSWSL